MNKKIRIESPDTAETNTGHQLNWKQDDAVPFGYYRGKMYVDTYGKSHHDISDTHNLGIYSYSRFKFEYPGRFWKKHKLITFWEYPETAEKMKKTISDIERAYADYFGENINLWDTYKIEILVSHNNPKKLTNWEYEDDGYDFDEFVPNGYDIKIIPLKNYKKSANRKKKELQMKHMMSPIAKGDTDIPTSIGSKKLPAGLTATQRHQMQMTSDSKMSLKKLVEYTIGKISKQINVKIDIDKTAHAGQQQFRHGDKPISDMEITEIVNLALPKIANMLMFDEIDMGDYVLIKHRATMLNIVGALHPGSNEEIDFVVVTVMRKENFIPKPNTKVIEI